MMPDIPNVPREAVCTCDHAMHDHELIPGLRTEKGPGRGACSACDCQRWEFGTFRLKAASPSAFQTLRNISV